MAVSCQKSCYQGLRFDLMTVRDVDYYVDQLSDHEKRPTYDYREGTLLAVAPGQSGGTEDKRE